MSKSFRPAGSMDEGRWNKGLLPWSLSLGTHLLFFFALFIASRQRTLDLSAVDLDLTSALPGVAVISAAAPEEEWRFSRIFPRVSTPVPKDRPSRDRAADAASAGGEGSEGAVGADKPSVSVPPRFKEQVKASYPDAARKADIEGVVVLQVEIDASGAVKKVDLVQGLGYGCDEAAIEAAEHSTFVPAFAGEEAVPVRIRIPYRFKFQN